MGVLLETNDPHFLSWRKKKIQPRAAYKCGKCETEHT